MDVSRRSSRNFLILAIMRTGPMRMMGYVSRAVASSE